MYKNIGMISLGCAKNQVDAETMLGILSKEAYNIVQKSQDADIIIINTCGFIGPAKEESIDTILEQAQYKINGRCKLLIVTGCLSERYKEQLMIEIPEIDALVGTGNFSEIIDIINESSKGNKVVKTGNIDILSNDNTPRIITTAPSTAYLKIAEGCDNHCTYCIIPKLRGKYRSRDINLVIEEAYKLVQQGIRELIIIAQDITRYGQETNTTNLIELIRKLSNIPDLKWIRLMYCYPDRVSDDLINIIASEEKVVNYIDIPIQHINNNILKSMNRHFSSDDIKRLIDKIRNKIPSVILRTSLIVGFPGEGDKEFKDIMNFIKEYPFEHLGVFKYSREEDTPAYLFENQVDEKLKDIRLSEVLKKQKTISKELNRMRIGQKCDVLIEGIESPGIYYGRSYGEAPDIDGKIFVSSSISHNIGDFAKVNIKKAYEYDLLGDYDESCK